MANKNYLHQTQYLHLDRSEVSISITGNSDDSVYLGLATSMSTMDFSTENRESTHYYVTTNINFTVEQLTELSRRLNLFLSNREVKPEIDDLIRNMEESEANA